jgi:ERCC4-related helicase
MSTGDFTSWFHHITGHSAPHDWQTRLAAAASCRNRLFRIGTGLGKTGSAHRGVSSR